MTNFEYYIAGGRRYEGWREFSTNYYNDGTGRCIDLYNDWLLKEHKEPILDDIEKEYLSNVIKPFRNKVVCISKDMSEDSAFIRIDIKNDFAICLPNFSYSTKMYANMKINKRYTLEELNL